jgi:hypothetical protein
MGEKNIFKRQTSIIYESRKEEMTDTGTITILFFKYSRKPLNDATFLSLTPVPFSGFRVQGPRGLLSAFLSGSIILVRLAPAYTWLINTWLIKTLINHVIV